LLLVPKLLLGNALVQKLRFMIPIEDGLSMASRLEEEKQGEIRDRP